MWGSSPPTPEPYERAAAPVKRARLRHASSVKANLTTAHAVIAGGDGLDDRIAAESGQAPRVESRCRVVSRPPWALGRGAQGVLRFHPLLLLGGPLSRTLRPALRTHREKTSRRATRTASRSVTTVRTSSSASA